MNERKELTDDMVRASFMAAGYDRNGLAKLFEWSEAINIEIAKRRKDLIAELTTEQIRELDLIITRDEMGRHFTEWSEWWTLFEELGLVEVFRPIHKPSGVAYDASHYQILLTDAGGSVLYNNSHLFEEET